MIQSYIDFSTKKVNVGYLNTFLKNWLFHSWSINNSLKFKRLVKEKIIWIIIKLMYVVFFFVFLFPWEFHLKYRIFLVKFILVTFKNLSYQLCILLSRDYTASYNEMSRENKRLQLLYSNFPLFLQHKLMMKWVDILI